MIVIESWDGHDINDGSDYKAGFSPANVWGLPDVTASVVSRPGAWPTVTGVSRPERRFSLYISIRDSSNIRTLRRQLMQWFDPEDEDPKKLIVADDTSSTNQRYVYAVCERFRPVIIGTVASYDLFRVELVTSGDVRWRAETATSETTWSVGSSGDTQVYNNTGEDDVYPVYEISPQANKTGGYSYKRYVHVLWRMDISSSVRYPIRLGSLGTDALVTAGKMQDDGDDLRVFIDGQEVTRELVDINTASTYIWIYPDFVWSPAPELELSASIAGAGTVDSIQLDDEVEMALLPSEGYVKIGSEVFSYGSRDLLTRRLTDIERGIWDTSAGAHSSGDTVSWLQHEVVIVYGNAAVSAPTYSDSFAFDIGSSDNDTWTYTDFDVIGTEEGGAWSWANGDYQAHGEYGLYGGTELAWPTTCSVIGAWKDDNEDTAVGWMLQCACGIESIAWSSGKNWAEDYTEFHSTIFGWSPRDARVQVTNFGISDPGSNSTWVAWSGTSDFEAEYGIVDRAGFYLYSSNSRMEMGAATVELETDNVPTQSIQSEEGNYTLDLALENETTDETLYVELEMKLNEVLEIDTYNRTAIYKLNESNQFQAISLDSSRLHWLRLQPGNNTLKYTDTGTNDVDVDVTYEKRTY
jgi:hypothetical protein